MINLLLGHFADAVAQCGDGKTGATCDTGLPTVAASSAQLQTGLQILFGILAAVAVLMVVIGALRYVTSEGNPDGTSKARSTIIYALVGLVVAISGEAIVGFVLGSLK